MPEDTKLSFTKEELAGLLKSAAEEAAKPMVESVKSMRDELTAMKKSQPRLVREPDDAAERQAFDEPKDIAEKRIAWGKKFAERAKTRPGSKLKEDEFSFVRFITAQTTHDWSHAPFERWAMEESKRTLTWANGSSGGFWVGSDFLPQEFVELLYAKLVARAAGITVIRPEGSPVQIPKLSAGSTAYWQTEGSVIVKSDVTPGSITMTPHWCVARVAVGQFTAKASAGAAETIIRNDIATQIALKIDKAVFEGAGTSGEPTGLLNTPYINTYAIDTNGGPFTIAGGYAMDDELTNDEVEEEGRVFVMNNRTWSGIRGFLIASEANRFLINPNPTVKEPRSLFGYPVYRTSAISKTNTKGSGTALANIFLVRMAEVLLAEWGTLEVAATDVGGDAWASNTIEVKATACVDVGVRHPEAVCLCSDSST